MALANCEQIQANEAIGAIAGSMSVSLFNFTADRFRIPLCVFHTRYIFYYGCSSPIHTGTRRGDSGRSDNQPI